MVLQTCTLLLQNKQQYTNIPINPTNLILKDRLQIDILDLKYEPLIKLIKYNEYYRAPEVEGNKETEKSQIFGLACTVFSMVTNIGPYDYKTEEWKEDDFFLTAEFPQESADKTALVMLQDSLSKDPAKRPSFLQFIQTLQPPTFHPMELRVSLDVGQHMYRFNS